MTIDLLRHILKACYTVLKYAKQYLEDDRMTTISIEIPLATKHYPDIELPVDVILNI